MSKNMDDSAHSFLFAEHTYGKKDLNKLELNKAVKYIRNNSLTNPDIKTNYEDQVDSQFNSNPEAASNSIEMKSLPKDTECHERDKFEIDYSLDCEKEFMIILANTSKVYSYPLVEEYMLLLLKHNGMSEYIQEYMKILKDNHINPNACIIDLGESSLQRFLINKEKRVFQFPPNETDNLMVIRDGECSSQLKLNK